MIFLRWSLFVAILLICYTVYTQILVPIWKGIPWFPIFNKRKNRLESIISENNQIILEQDMIKNTVEQMNVIEENKNSIESKITKKPKTSSKRTKNVVTKRNTKKQSKTK